MLDIQYDHPVATWLDPETGDVQDHAAVMTEAANAQSVLLGETHDQYDIHRWQLAIIAGIRGRRDKVMVGFEMFPKSAQPVLDEWIEGGLSQDEFLDKVKWRDVWGFDPALYMPIFNYCREMGIPMLALNCYRALVTRVGKEGWDAIPEEERDGLTPSKEALPEYKNYLFGMVAGPDSIFLKEGEEADARRARFIRAQQTWDRAFACNISYALKENPDHLVVGIIGRGHLEYGFGTPYQLDDLGVTKNITLLPGKEAKLEAKAIKGIAKAIYRLPTSFEVAPERENMP